MDDGLAILLISGSYERAHYAFMLAVAAAAVDRGVILFATNDGCHAVAHRWSALHGSGRDADLRATGVAGLDELREAAGELGVRLLACDTGVLISSLAHADLLPTVELTGLPTFLTAIKGHQVITL